MTETARQLNRLVGVLLLGLSLAAGQGHRPVHVDDHARLAVVDQPITRSSLPGTCATDFTAGKPAPRKRASITVPPANVKNPVP